MVILADCWIYDSFILLEEQEKEEKKLTLFSKLIFLNSNPYLIKITIKS
jgi:hypothetical protein